MNQYKEKENSLSVYVLVRMRNEAAAWKVTGAGRVVFHRRAAKDRLNGGTS